MSDALLLHGKLAKVRASIGRIQKNGHHPQFGPYVHESDIADPVNTLLGDVGVSMMQTVRHDLSSHEVVMIEKIRQNGERDTTLNTRATVWLETIFTDGDSGETYSVLTPEFSTDTGDNAMKKALTGARKSMLQLVFNIAFVEATTRDDVASGGRAPATGGGKTPKEPAQPDQLRKIDVLVREKQPKPDQLRELLKAASNGFASAIGENTMSRRDADNLIAALVALPFPAGASQPTTIERAGDRAPATRAPIEEQPTGAFPSVDDDGFWQYVPTPQRREIIATLQTGAVAMSDLTELTLAISQGHVHTIGELTDANDRKRVVAQLRDLMVSRRAGGPN